MILMRAFVVWLAIIAVETIHGIIRSLFIAPIMGDLPSRQLGVLIGSMLIFGVAYWLICWIHPINSSEKFLVGILWVVLTIGFEIGLGTLAGFSFDRIVEDYDIQRGGLMLFGLTFMLFTPYLGGRIKNCA